MNLLDFKSFNKKALILATLSVATLASCSKDELSNDISSQNPAEQQMPTNQGMATGEYIVVMKEGSELTNRKRGLAYSAQLAMVEAMGQRVLTENGITDIKLTEDNTFASIANGFTARLSKEQLESLKKDNRVAYIEEDQYIALGKKQKTTNTAQSTTTTSTTTQKLSWGITKVGGFGDGTGKTAWIIDSGIDPNHSDLNVDKARSKSFLASTQAGNYTSYADELGHGTQVAGIVGAKNNGYGAVGVAPNASLVSLRVLDANGSALTSRIIRALNHVAYYGKAGDVVNYSIGGGISTTLDDAAKKVAAKGIYIAMASGNNAGDCTYNSPQRVNATNMFTVSAMDNLGRLANFSNYGSPVDYSAPGVGVYTTAKGGGYATVSGTSFAAPHMAGVLLLTGGRPKTAGYITGDKDSKADPIASR